MITPQENNINSNEIRNSIIIGSGPAGWTAAIYLARANFKPLVISGMEKGGQLMKTTDVENFPGFTSILGNDLMAKMEEHAMYYGTDVVVDDVTEVDLSSRPFTVKTGGGDIFKAKSIIISTGASAKWLGIESEKKFLGYGVSGCATCDGFFFKNKVVGIVGGGNTSATEALYLTRHASKVIMIHRKNEFRSEKILQERIDSNSKIEKLTPYEIQEILGSSSPKKVTGAILKNTIDGSTKQIDLDGIFIAIGHKPNTDIFKNFLNLDPHGYIQVVPGTSLTNIPGVFAAGDVHDQVYRQAVTSAGSGCMAALDAGKFLDENN